MNTSQTHEIKKVDAPEFKILLVDDRVENLLTLEQIIEAGNRTIIKASSANEALKIVLGNDIHLILLDVQMPEMDGYEAADLLRMNPKTKHIPVVFVSAVSRSEKNPIDKYEPGTVDFLFKPLDIAETKSKVMLFENLHHLKTENTWCLAKYDKSLKEMDNFIYTVSHDVKAPLRAIENLADWIEGDLGGNTNENIQENILLLKNRIGRMRNMLDGITEYSRVNRISERKEQVNINPLIPSILQALAVPAEYVFNVQNNMPVLFTEKNKLQKVFAHLIQNCVLHHNNKGGKVTVSFTENADSYCFSISDDGPGIKPQYHEKVFELFHTLKSKDTTETAGVGLSVVKRIVESLGQKVWIDSGSTSGTTVYFTWHK